MPSRPELHEHPAVHCLRRIAWEDVKDIHRRRRLTGEVMDWARGVNIDQPVDRELREAFVAIGLITDGDRLTEQGRAVVRQIAEGSETDGR